MIHPKLLLKKFPNLRKQFLTILSILLLITSPLMTFAKEPNRLVLPQQPSQPCVDSDTSERCQLRRAVSSALDEIEKLKSDLNRAREAITAQEKTIQDAKTLIEASAKEREASDKTIAAAQKVIDQQQGLIATYERAIATLQQMVQMCLNRIDTLEKKVDKANGRAAILGTILTIAGVLATIFIKR